MVLKKAMDRRQLAKGFGALALSAAPLLSGRMAFAQDPSAAANSADPWLELDAMTKTAEELGLAAPRMTLGPATASGDYNDVAMSIVDFIDQVEASAATTPTASPGDVETLLDHARQLLRELREDERSPREPEEGDDTGDAPNFAGPSITAPDLNEIAANYRELFASCQIREEKRGEVMSYVNKMLSDSNRKRYQEVSDRTCIPWHFVGAIHALEASFDFGAHLHNGDSLKRRTWQIPANRPKEWLPPSDWASSAIDALSMKGYDKEKVWGLPEVCYRWERYNGWRSRLLYNINTPYLWSYSNHYSKGKFVRDNVWDSNAVSKQPGAAVLLRAMVDMGAVPAPA